MADQGFIYLDHAATTPVAAEVVEAMLPYFKEQFGNPSSIYSLGQKSKDAITRSRETIAKCLGVKQSEIYFTAGGSESDNWALKAAAYAYGQSPLGVDGKNGRHIITSAIEHHAVLSTCEYLESLGFEITYIGVDRKGRVKLDELKEAIRPDTILISIMYANNEVGTIQPMKEIGTIAREHGILFHTDAVQAFGHIPVDIKECHIDLLSASGHKLGGPKGIGFLYIKEGVKIRSFLHGGQQERGRRAGTENVPAIVGFAAAVGRAFTGMEQSRALETELRDYLIHRIETEIKGAILNGSKEERLPGNVNFSFPGRENQLMLIMLDMKRICVSGGSACTSGSLEPSHVLLAMGQDAEIAAGSLRFSLDASNTREEMDVVVEALKEILGEG